MKIAVRFFFFLKIIEPHIALNL